MRFLTLMALTFSQSLELELALRRRFARNVVTSCRSLSSCAWSRRKVSAEDVSSDRPSSVWEGAVRLLPVSEA
jgi:hypothetical protein